MEDIIIFAIIAALVGYRLYNQLGNKRFNEVHKKQSTLKVVKGVSKNVVNETIETPKETGNETVENKEALQAILEKEPQFTVNYFLNGAKSAYEIILTAFKDEETETLKQLLSVEVFEQFSKAIQERTAKYHWILVSDPMVSIEKIEVDKQTASITTSFYSEEIHYLEDAKGNIISGDASLSEQKSNIWTFQKKLGKDSIWKLVSTE